MKRRLALLLALPGLLGGCALAGSDYRAPQVAAPAAWAGTAPGVTAGGLLELARWWAVFDDPVLNDLVEQAAGANLDQRLAAARVREARAQRGVAAADLWPNAGFDATYWHGRTNLAPAPPAGIVASLYNPAFDAAWEIDLFGGRRRALEAADADLGAALEDSRATLVTVLGEVGRAYVELRGFQRQAQVARDAVATQAATLQVVRARLDAGLASEFDLTRAEAQLATVESAIPPLEAQRERSLHRLAVLLGQEPSALAARLAPAAPIPVPPSQVRVGVPADLLLRRPDVRRAERELAAATARAGVAAAGRYPRLALAAAVGLQNTELEKLTAWDSRVWSTALSLRWPIFDAGRVRALVGVQDARQEQAALRYAKALLAAREDVENALAAYGREQERHRSLVAAAAANGQALETARALYETGLTEYLQVLDAERALYAVRTQLVQSETAAVADLVALYKALGGGWENDATLSLPPGTAAR